MRQKYISQLLQIKKNKEKRLQTATPSKYPQQYFKNKACLYCGTFFTPKAPSELYCSDYCKDYTALNHYYKRCYNITIEDYLDMAEKQNYLCAICGRPNIFLQEHHAGTLVVDHDHRTGNVRGLLCHNCNRGLGLFSDDSTVLKTAINYLESATTIPNGSTLK